MVPEHIIEICVAIDIAILTIAYPIIVDKTASIGDKYHSQYIPVLFTRELPERIFAKITIGKGEYRISNFEATLYATLVSFFFLIFRRPPLFGWDNWIINNSADLLVLSLSSVLTVFFFIWLNKVVLYSGKSKSLLKHIIRKHDAVKGEEIREYHLKAINELTFYAIEKQDEHLQKTLLDFYFKVFAGIRKNHTRTTHLQYPIDLYFLVSRLNAEATETQNRKLKDLEHMAVSGSWLLGKDFETITISEETYKWLWNNIFTISNHPRLVKMFWANSSEYFDFELNEIHEEYGTDYSVPNNIEEIRKRKDERSRFIEFHYALGGLLLYRKQYSTIAYLFEYSQSDPPDYVLLPERMTEIFNWLEHFRNEFRRNGMPIDWRYYFEDHGSLGSKKQVGYWICCYLALLFIRQYTLNKRYGYQDFTAPPNLPKDIWQLENWLDNVSFFEKCLDDILGNKKLLKKIEFGLIVDKNKDAFKTFITSLKEAIGNKIEEQKHSAKMSREKIEKFYSSSSRIISEAFKDYELVLVKSGSLNESELGIPISGSKILLPKSAFTEGDVPNINYDSVFAEAVANQGIRRQIPFSFSFARTRKYLFNRDNILVALNKIINGRKDIVIVGIRVGPEFKQLIQASVFSDKVRYIPATQTSFQDTLFVLSQNDMPWIEYRDISQDEKDELKLFEINPNLRLYASVIDINDKENEKIKGKWDDIGDKENLTLKVQVAIALDTIIHWKNHRSVIQVNITSQYREQGIQDDINDIVPLPNEELES